MANIFPITDKDEMTKTLEELAKKFESGEVTCCALRLYMPDGTYQDMTIGGVNEEDKQIAMTELKNMLEHKLN